jgi:putative ABC transport system permease protein
MTALWYDLRYALRLLRFSPGFTFVALLTLALGIGANTAIFQLIDAIRLRTIPVRNPEELATIRIADRTWGSGSFSGQYSQLTFPLWEQIRKRQEGFSAISAWGEDQFNLATGGEVHYARGIWVSGEFFDVLGIRPFWGRLLSASDDQAGCGAGGAVLSYAFWQRNYGGDPAAVGKRLTLNGNSFEIIGVTPPSFTGVSIGNFFDVAIPLCSEPILHKEYGRLLGPNARWTWWLATIGRLKPGWTGERATAQIKAASPAILQETVPPNYDASMQKKYLEYRFAAYPASKGFSELRQQSETPLWLLLGISCLVLLIACANLANLMLARASARERQLSIRLALGASRGQLIRQLLCESLLLAAGGAVSGTLLAVVISRALVSFISTPNNPVFLDIALDWRVLAFTAGLAILTTVLFGLTPALRVTRSVPNTFLQAEGRGTTGGRERFSLRRILVVSQVAFSVVLLVGALLFVRSLRNLLTLDAGFQQNGVLITSVEFARLSVAPEHRQEFKRELLERVRAIPGVESAAGALLVPLGGNSWNRWVLSDTSEEHRGTTWQNYVSPGYFSTLETPLLSGRDFDERDTSSSPKVAIVNQTFERKFLKGGNPIGQSFRIWEAPGTPEPFYEVVGVVKDSKYQDMHEEFLATAYFPYSQLPKPGPDGQLIVRSGLSLTSLLTSMKQTIADVNPEIDVDFKVFKTQIRESLMQDELMATLSGFFGFLAALLAAIGLYGVISYMVVQRTKEIGVRMAIGAQGLDVIRMVMREAGILTIIGLLAGTSLAFASAQVAKSLLFGLKPRDPFTFGTAMITLAAVATLASFAPAYRASRLDPLTALRYE